MTITTLQTPDLSFSTPAKWRLWLGRSLSGLVTFAMLMSAVMKLAHNPKMVENIVGKLGYGLSDLTVIGALELASAVLYVIPRTAVLGAILISGYFGGAIANHLRIADSFAIPLTIAVLAWAGLFLRD